MPQGATRRPSSKSCFRKVLKRGRPVNPQKYVKIKAYVGHIERLLIVYHVYYIPEISRRKTGIEPKQPGPHPELAVPRDTPQVVPIPATPATRVICPGRIIRRAPGARGPRVFSGKLPAPTGHRGGSTLGLLRAARCPVPGSPQGRYRRTSTLRQ